MNVVNIQTMNGPKDVVIVIRSY